MYIPAVSTKGSNNPVPLASAGLQVPPTSGVPPRLLKRSMGEPLLQKAIAPSVPAFGSRTIDTITVEAAVHDVGPVIVYV